MLMALLFWDRLIARRLGGTCAAKRGRNGQFPALGVKDIGIWRDDRKLSLPGV
jgi:hypothetical protein